MNSILYKVGIIGMGRMGEIRKKEIENHTHFELKAVTDVNLEVQKKYSKIFLNTWEEVLGSGIDAVFICTFNDIIPEIVCKALEKGIHVFSEKPPGKSIACVEKMKKSKDHSPHQVLKFGFNHRFHYSILRAKELIESGQFGKILWARGSYGKAAETDFANAWRSNMDQAGGGILLDQGIHMADLLIHFMGNFVEIKSMVESQFWDIPMEDNAYSLLKSEKGAVAMLHSSATHWKNHFSLEIGLDSGLIHLDGILSNSMSYAPEVIKVYKKDLNPTDRKLGNPVVQEESFTKDDSWKLEIEDFYQALRNKSDPQYGTIDDAMSVMKLIYGIYNNAKKN
ncbi:MAG: putative dehydrogenase [Bacteriovoracaceae bacterium]|jgi:predicted dehydrogenase